MSTQGFTQGVQEGKVFEIDAANKLSSLQTDTRAASFIAANSEFLSSTSSQLEKVSQSFSVGCWTKPANVSGVNSIMGKWSANYVIHRQNSDYTFTVYNGSPKEARVVGAAATGVWAFVVGVYDFSAGLVKISVNGGSFVTLASADCLNSGNPPFYIGGQFTASQYYTGEVDAAFIYDEALSLSQIADLYNAGNGTDYNNLTIGQKTNLISWWKLNENGDQRKDSHGTNHLTNNNTVGYTAGKVSESRDYFYSKDLVTSTDGTPIGGVELVDNAFVFDGAGDSIDMGLLDIGTPTTPVTYEAWVYLQTGAPTDATIFGEGRSNFKEGISLRVLNDTIRMVVLTTPNAFIIKDSVNTITKDNWHHVVGVYDGSLTTDGFTFYIDGILSASYNAITNGTMASTFTNRGNMFIGSLDGVERDWKGNISNVKIYNRELTAAEVLQNYNQKPHLH